jgi:predicted transcriptional regulator
VSDLRPKTIVELADIERLQDSRRRVFVDAYQCGFAGWNDKDELEVVNNRYGANLGLSMSQLHEILDFLAGLGLLEVEKLAIRWDYKITPLGVQCYEGDAPWPKGVSPR